MSELIFDYFPKEKTLDIIKSYQACTGLHVQLISDDGCVLFSAGNRAGFCYKFSKFFPEGESCATQHAAAGRQALTYGDSYLFSCKAGLFHIVYPLISRETMFGSVIAGPFLMDDPESSLLLDGDNEFNISEASLKALKKLSHKIKVISPTLAYEYSRLLYHLIDSLNTGSREILFLNQQKLLQQSRINEAVQNYKTSGAVDGMNYPLDKENMLAASIRKGDLEAAKEIFNELLGFIMLYENYDLERIRVRLVELCSLLSRTAIERGSEPDMILSLNEKLVSSILKSNDFYDMCYKLQDNMEIFTESFFFSESGINKMIKDAAEYISRHFSENINLTDVAEKIHLNPSYLSSLFKQVTGEGFKEYLNNVRIEEAKNLLEHTDHSILEIAVACGYSDQSYFTKVFKKVTGLTPKQYRM